MILAIPGALARTVGEGAEEGESGRGLLNGDNNVTTIALARIISHWAAVALARFSVIFITAKWYFKAAGGGACRGFFFELAGAEVACGAT